MQSSRQSVLEESLYYKPTERQVAQFLITIQQKPYNIKKYKQLLQEKEEFIKNNQVITGGFQKVNQILDPKVNRVSTQEQNIDQFSEVGGLCPICYEQIKGKGLNCNICKKSVCRNCLTRNRLMKNGSILKFCQKCDRSFLQALLNKQFLKEFAMYEKAFETLVRQQQGLEVLLNCERSRIKTQDMNEQKKIQLKNVQKIKQLKFEQQIHRQKIQQIKNKIEWGQSMNKGLRIKYRKIKKQLKQSFGSANSGSQYAEWQPPKAEDDDSIGDDGINKSFITTNFDKSSQEEIIQGVFNKESCQCQLI